MIVDSLEQPVLAVDLVVLRVRPPRLEALLRSRAEEPFRGALALPGVALRTDETLAEAARRALREKAGWPAETAAGIYLEQLATFDGLYRDPRGRTISVAYLGLARATPSLFPGAAWQAATGGPPGGLPFDHGEILAAAVARLRGKLRYTNIAHALLPPAFRIEELQAVYEAILGRALNRSNFRNKLLKLGLIEQERSLLEAGGRPGGRPPHLYRFARTGLEAEERDFL